jgi:hypothetical protein
MEGASTVKTNDTRPPDLLVLAATVAALIALAIVASGPEQQGDDDAHVAAAEAEVYP